MTVGLYAGSVNITRICLLLEDTRFGISARTVEPGVWRRRSS